MPKLYILNNFQHKGKVFRTNEDGDAILSLSVGQIKEEIARGKHPTSGKWMSGVLNHCAPADVISRRLILGEQPDPDELEAELEEAEETETDESEGEVLPGGSTPDPEDEEREAIYAEFKRIGKACDKRWKLTTLRNNLAKAKKETGN